MLSFKPCIGFYAGDSLSQLFDRPILLENQNVATAQILLKMFNRITVHYALEFILFGLAYIFF